MTSESDVRKPKILAWLPSYVTWLMIVILINFPYLHDPTYWDMLMGMFAQIRWLALNDLNYIELLRQDDFFGGGACIYPFAWLPTMAFASLSQLGLSFSAITVAGHLVACAAGAAILDTFYRFLEPYCDRAWCIMATIALLSCPLFLAQTSTFNMETLITAFSFAAFASYCRGQIMKSLIFSILAFHMHPRGVIPLLAISAMSGFEFLVSSVHWSSLKDETERESVTANFKRSFQAVCAYLAGSFVFASYLTLFPNRPSNMKLFSGFFEPENLYALILVPEFTILTVLFVSFVVATQHAQFFRVGRESMDSEEQATILFRRCLIFLAAYVVLMTNVNIVLVRYHLTVYPILGVGIMVALSRIREPKKLVTAGLAIAIAVNALNFRGDLYSQLYSDDLLKNCGHKLECTMQYHDDLVLNQKIARYVETEFNLGETVFVTHWPITQVLAVPEAGYLESDEVSVATFTVLDYVDIKPITQIYELTGTGDQIRQSTEKDVIWIASPNIFEPYAFGSDIESRLSIEKIHEINVGDQHAVFLKLPKTFLDSFLAESLRFRAQPESRTP